MQETNEFRRARCSMRRRYSLELVCREVTCGGRSKVCTLLTQAFSLLGRNDLCSLTVRDS